jgi:hypothetical protein
MFFVSKPAKISLIYRKSLRIVGDFSQFRVILTSEEKPQIGVEAKMNIE